ncbi:MAG: hypothetical protein COV52_02505 [Gammaproteobacteria bacterium CG11_big_fil_rev_8_21_14_0_20_46_22]|nr:MAG: hypothetical protein COW05_08545 [Gammaproteobacteria bacterium CG12_big_fil_rev_8_21_14_0_65_46_12]PIR11652.1 MAG: hypothetical protein COV52_02505 [Gammaproteobacteria bacterium CG11_big_fil_rev_8_21_14_0_20_46_22]
MATFDIVLLVIVLLFGVLGFIRGFVKQLIVTLVWFVGFGLAIVFTQTLAAHTGKYIHNPDINQTVAFLLIFFATWIVGTIIKLIIVSGLGGLSSSTGGRFVGFVLGLLEGASLCVLLIFIIQNSNQQTANWFNTAMLVPPLEHAAAWMQHFAFKAVAAKP